MKRIVVVGAAGRMGRALIRGLQQQAVPGLALSGAVDLWDAPERGKDAGLVAGVDACGVSVESDLAQAAEGADAVIDFSGPHGTAGNAPRCAAWGLPLVIGTTGLDPAGRAAVEAAAEAVPVVWAPNMSLGVNLLLDMVEQCAARLARRGYDVEIVERHHRRKKDAPSGTALALGEAVARGAGWTLDEVAVHGRRGEVKEDRPAAQIGFHAVRGGDFVGDHTVVFAAEGESIELSHRATSRDTFAIGALRAAAWVCGRSAGLYTMRDVLGLEEGPASNGGSEDA